MEAELEIGGLTGVGSWLACFGPSRDHQGSGASAPAHYRQGTESRALSLLASPKNHSPEVADLPGCRVILDGVVYNRAELEDEYDLVATAATSNAEFAAQAYRAQGEAALARIRGVFALIVWDREHDHVLCMRDPLGMHPLFYAKTADALLIAPSIDTLLGQRLGAGGINRTRLVEYLTRHWTGSEETCFTGVLRIPSGHMLRVNRNGERVFRYWDPLPADRAIAWISDDEAEARFSALLAQAVDRALAHQPAGILLSGGLDSSTVAMIAADRCRRANSAPPWALSLSVPNPYDEEGSGRGIADDLGMPHYVLPHDDAFGSGGPLAAGLSLTRALPSPLYNVGQPAYLRLSLAAGQRGCRSMLTGEGSDEWLGMSPLLAENMLRPTNILGMLRLGLTLSQYYSNVRWGGLGGVAWQFGMRPALRSAWLSAVSVARRLSGVQAGPMAAAMPGATSGLVCEPWIAPDRHLRQQIAERCAAGVAADTHRRGIEHAYRRAILARLESPQPGLRSEESFLVGQLSGVPQRDPFWDADLIDLIVRIRPAVRNRGGISKALLRNTLANRFPSRGFASQRKGMSRLAFIRSAMLAQAPVAARALGKDWVLGELGIVDPKRAIEFVDHCPEDNGWRVWYLINLETWARAHIQSRPPQIG